jgi:thiol-disulfide isomerase/thioredoxin
MAYLYLIFLLTFFSSPAWAMGQAPTPGVSSSLIGRQALDAVLTKSDGTSGSVLGARQGKKAILVFWATWCPHCYEDFTTINDNLAAAEQEGIKIMLVDIGETPQAVKDYFDRRQMKLVSFVDTDSSLQEPYRLFGVPTLIFINEKGIVRNVSHQFPPDFKNYFS